MLVVYIYIHNKIEQCALPVTTIMALWQLVNLGTRCTVTHCRIALWSHQSAQTVIIVMSSPCFLNSRVMSFLVRSDCGPLVFRKTVFIRLSQNLYSPKPSPSPRSTSQSTTETPTSLCIAANPFYLTTRPPGQRKTKTTCST